MNFAKTGTAHRVVALALVVLSAHLFLGLYPLPSQRAAEIDRMAQDAASLGKQFETFKLDASDAETNKLRWAETLTREYWTVWGLIVLGIALSFTAAILALSGSRWWPWTALSVCVLFLAFSVPPVVAMSIDSGGFFHWTSVVTRSSLKDGTTFNGLLNIYNLIVLPVAYTVLSVGVIFLWLHERRHSKR